MPFFIENIVMNHKKLLDTLGKAHSLTKLGLKSRNISHQKFKPFELNQGEIFR